MSEKEKIVIVDPVSSEFNRGSFCYSPYILYSMIKESTNHTVKFYENFSAADIDELPQDADRYYMGLWSYPQIEHVEVLLRFLPREAEKKVFGYDPLILSNQMPLLTMSNEQLDTGIANYVKYYDDFNYLLLSDCDMHLSEYSDETVYPLFTSYGCPRGCSFCPSTVQQSKRVVIDTSVVLHNLQQLKSEGKTNIHFTDEDFFFSIDRAYEIAEIMANLGGFKAIALASRSTLKKFIEKYGTNILKEAGFKLFEVGLEAADAQMSKAMKKGKVSDCEWLSANCDIPILWLTITFFPGETIKTLNATGEFLAKHGFDYEELNSRITTNGTEGGLGQFFQFYHGTNNADDLEEKGMFLTQRPVRLIPSYLPFSFLSSRVRTFYPERIDQKWYDLYRVNTLEDLIESGKTVEQIITKADSPIDACVSLAISSRLRVLEG